MADYLANILQGGNAFSHRAKVSVTERGTLLCSMGPLWDLPLKIKCRQIEFLVGPSEVDRRFWSKIIPVQIHSQPNKPSSVVSVALFILESRFRLRGEDR